MSQGATTHPSGPVDDRDSRPVSGQACCPCLHCRRDYFLAVGQLDLLALRMVDALVAGDLADRMSGIFDE